MASNDDFKLDEALIRKLGLRETDKPVSALTALNGRVYEYPHLENVFIMEYDLYGNRMPEGSCFLAFNGRHGLMGTHLRIEELKKASTDDIKNIVQKNIDS